MRWWGLWRRRCICCVSNRGVPPPATGDVVVDDLLLVLKLVRNLPIDYPQHPEKKQRMRLKKPHRGVVVCGELDGGVVSDDAMVTGTSTLLVLVLVLVSFVFIS